MPRVRTLSPKNRRRASLAVLPAAALLGGMAVAVPAMADPANTLLTFDGADGAVTPGDVGFNTTLGAAGALSRSGNVLLATSAPPVSVNNPAYAVAKKDGVHNGSYAIESDMTSGA